MNAEILAIGDEILIGQITDTNSPWIASELLKININVAAITIVPDNRQKMLNAIDNALNRSELIIITGGLGPTKDDLTKDVLAEYFKSGWKWDSKTLEIIEKRFVDRSLEFKEINKKQAYLPEKCSVIINHWGTAPGMLFRKDGKILISMPGVPYEMQNMFSTYVLEEIKKEFSPAPILVHHFLTINIPESILSERLKDIEEDFPEEIKLAYLPHINIVRLRLTCFTNGLIASDKQFEDYVLKIRNTLGNSIVTEQNISLEEYVFTKLQQKNMTISFAESCTGGLISSSFTKISGVSSVFKGAVVTYSNEVKNTVLKVSNELLQKHGAVSSEVAYAMAEGCRIHLKTDFALSVTGIAGPSGGTDTKPVGTVFIGLSSKEKTITKQLFYPAKRQRIMEFSMLSVLNLLREHYLL